MSRRIKQNIATNATTQSLTIMFIFVFVSHILSQCFNVSMANAQTAL